jgi:hypothetical protein
MPRHRLFLQEPLSLLGYSGEKPVSGPFLLPQVPLCRVNQAKIISLIGLEVPALRTLAGAPPRGALSAPFFSADHQPSETLREHVAECVELQIKRGPTINGTQ